MEAVTRKPYRTSITTHLISQTARDLQLDEGLVEHVIMTQYKKVQKAVMEEEEIEISGFATLKISPHKVGRKLKKVERSIQVARDKMTRETSEDKLEKLNDYLEGLLKMQTFLLSKKEKMNNGN